MSKAKNLARAEEELFRNEPIWDKGGKLLVPARPSAKSRVRVSRCDASRIRRSNDNSPRPERPAIRHINDQKPIRAVRKDIGDKKIVKYRFSRISRDLKGQKQGQSPRPGRGYARELKDHRIAERLVA